MGNTLNQPGPVAQEQYQGHDVSVVKPAPEDKPRPMVFAIMRNGHEVIRSNMADIEDFIDAGEWSQAYHSYHLLQKWEGTHKLMEKGYEIDQTPEVLDENLEEMQKSHAELNQLVEKVDEAHDVHHNDEFAEHFKEFRKANEEHMKLVETIMEPKVKDMTLSMTNEILALVVSSPDFKFFVQHAVAILEKHPGNASRAPALVFSHALCACGTTRQWKEWRGWIKESVSKQTFKEIESVTEHPLLVGTTCF